VFRSGKALAAAIVALAVLAPAAPAAMTHSEVSVGQTYGFFDEDATTPPVRHITATSDGAQDDPVDLLCLQGTTNVVGPLSTTLGAGGSLSYDIPESALQDLRCRLAVVPDGQTTADPNVFSGPTVSGGYFDVFIDGAKTWAFEVDHAYAKAYTDFYDLGDCGLCHWQLLDTDGVGGAYLFSYNAVLGGTHSEPGGGSRPDLVIDGKRAYTPYEAHRTLPGWLPLTVTHTQDPNTGDMSYVEEEPLLFCQPDDTTCSSYTATAIHWKRTVKQDHEGRLVSITDELSNTDSAAPHDYDVDFEEYEFNSGHSGFRFPGESDYANHAANDVVNSGFGPISTIGFKWSTSVVATDGDNPLGSLTVSPQPARALFLNTNGFNLQFKGTIPAGGTQTIRQVFSMGTSESELAGYIAQAENEAGVPSVAITDPAADGSTVSSASLTVKGTASDDKGAIASLKVNGADVSVGGDGTWSAPMTLTEGPNTITATVTDTVGNTATATRTVTYTKPPPPPPPVLFATISKSGKVKVTRKGKKILVDTGIKVSCPAGTTACTAAVSAKTVKAVAAKLKKSKITVAKKTFRIAAGKTQKIVLTLSSKGAKALKRNKKLKIKVTVAAKVGTGTAKTTSRTITIKQPKKKR
jgi:hypothetical protein